MIQWAWDNRTKVFGFIQVTIAVVAAQTELFGREALLWVMFVNALLTAWLGFFNSSRLRDESDQAGA